MRIQPDVGPKKIETSSKKKEKTSGKATNATQAASFAQNLSSKGSDLIKESLDELMKMIEDAGEILQHSPTDENLTMYKDSIKAFMNKALNQSYVVEKSFDVHNRLYIIVREVDRKLIEITDNMMLRQNKTMELVDRLQEIKGMLMDMYI